ncbi:hypothetical protein HUT16_00030 [Kitasatospora sp. NA04385]|nr:hypothetical protein [Kitasatospora sp. NA04385]QKW17667.1 hypothetical protein HUT16_00030 [Kitasatospora sp. NA04385]
MAQGLFEGGVWASAVADQDKVDASALAQGEKVVDAAAAEQVGSQHGEVGDGVARVQAAAIAQGGSGSRLG